MENTSAVKETHTPDTRFLSLNPSNLEVIGEVTNTSREEIDAKIEKAKKPRNCGQQDRMQKEKRFY